MVLLYRILITYVRKIEDLRQIVIYVRMSFHYDHRIPVFMILKESIKSMSIPINVIRVL